MKRSVLSILLLACWICGAEGLTPARGSRALALCSDYAKVIAEMEACVREGSKITRTLICVGAKRKDEELMIRAFAVCTKTKPTYDLFQARLCASQSPGFLSSKLARVCS